MSLIELVTGGTTPGLLASYRSVTGCDAIGPAVTGRIVVGCHQSHVVSLVVQSSLSSYKSVTNRSVTSHGYHRPIPCHSNRALVGS